MRVAIVGAGIVGLSIGYELVRRGQPFDCFEADEPMAGRSVGDTRIFRFAHEVPELVALAASARPAWAAWSRAAGAELVDTRGTVVSGDVEPFATAMAAADAPYRIDRVPPPLPTNVLRGPFLVDPNGGVIAAGATGAFLSGHVAPALVPERVDSVELDGDAAVLVAAGGVRRYDAVLVAAGADTPRLVRPLGIAVPDVLEHHARFTYPLRPADAGAGAAFPCWIDRSEAWAPGFMSYGQHVGSGYWAIGGHLPDRDTAWELGRAEATARARRAVAQYAAQYVTAVVPEPVGEIYCSLQVGLGDGIHVARSGPVLAVWGSNLFKFAPVIGAAMAGAALDGGLPDYGFYRVPA